jgi:hypothetical protein
MDFTIFKRLQASLMKLFWDKKVEEGVLVRPPGSNHKKKIIENSGAIYSNSTPQSFVAVVTALTSNIPTRPPSYNALIRSGNIIPQRAFQMPDPPSYNALIRSGKIIPQRAFQKTGTRFRQDPPASIIHYHMPQKSQLDPPSYNASNRGLSPNPFRL